MFTEALLVETFVSVNVLVAFVTPVAKLMVSGLGERETVPVGPLLVTLNVTVLVLPFGVTTVTVLAPRAALLAIVKFAVTSVPPTVALTEFAATPVPEMVTAVAPIKNWPLIVTGTVVPRLPEAGLMEVSVGPWTVKVTPMLVPPGVTTRTV